MPMISLICIWVSTTSGGQGARGQGGSKLKLAPLTPRSLPSLPSPCCHSPHSQLTGPCFQCPMNSLVCIGVPTTSWGQGARRQGGSKLNLAPITLLTLLPSLPSLPMSNEQLSIYWGPHHLWEQGAWRQCGSKLKLAPVTLRSLPLLQLSPNSLQLTPSLLQLAPNGQCMCWGPQHLWGVRG